MFIECQTHYDKAIFYNVNNVVFVGEMNGKTSIQLDDGTFCQLPDEYSSIVKRIIELSKIEASPSTFVQFTTKKEERIAFPIRRIFYILEEDSSTAIMFNDGTRIEIVEDFETVSTRVMRKLETAIEVSNEELKALKK